MNVRPILFSGPMVRALLDGRKTQTRRVLKPQPTAYSGATQPPPSDREKKHSAPYFDAYNGGPFWCWWDEYDRQGPDWINVPYAPGDLLWVKETHWWWGYWIKRQNKWRFIAVDDGGHPVLFERPDVAPGRTHLGYHTRPSIFMPRACSRLTLHVTDVRVQRVQEISEDDARAEGCEPHREIVVDGSFGPPVARPAFRALWNSINAKRGYGWGVNPWVAAITFTVQQANVDDVIARPA